MRVIMVAAVTLAVFLPLCETIRAQSGQVLSLEQTIQALTRTAQTNATEKGHGWRKWSVVNTIWDTILATTTDQDTTKANWIMASRDTLPLIAVMAEAQTGRYQHVKLDKTLNQGWSVWAKSSSPKGIVDWVAIGNEHGNIYVASEGKGVVPHLLMMLTKEGSCIILSWDSSGEEFESILLYDLRKKSIEACCNFTLQPGKVEYLLVKGPEDNWLEFTYEKGNDNPIGIGKHSKVPGRLSSALMDLNRDGQMDIMANLSDNKDSTIHAEASYATLGKATKQHLELLKKDMIDNTIKAYQIWMDVQLLWYQLKPLGVQLPELLRLSK